MDNLGQIVWDKRTSEPVIFLGYGLGMSELDPQGIYIFRDNGEFEHVPDTADYGPASRYFARIVEADKQSMFVGSLCERLDLAGGGNFGRLHIEEETEVMNMAVDAIAECWAHGVVKVDDDTFSLKEVPDAKAD